eukprot:1393273-Amorphochlora_amoeboformis.AAC.3
MLVIRCHNTEPVGQGCDRWGIRGNYGAEMRVNRSEQGTESVWRWISYVGAISGASTRDLSRGTLRISSVRTAGG